jgi:hypothetical protein
MSYILFQIIVDPFPQESKQELQTIQNEIHDKLTKRGKLREEKVVTVPLLSSHINVVIGLTSSPSQNLGVRDTTRIYVADYLSKRR